MLIQHSLRQHYLVQVQWVFRGPNAKLSALCTEKTAPGWLPSYGWIFNLILSNVNSKKERAGEIEQGKFSPHTAIQVKKREVAEFDAQDLSNWHC